MKSRSIIGEDDPNTAVAYMPMFQEKYVPLIRRQNRWFINVEKDQLAALTFLTKAVLEPNADRINQVKKILAQSNTVKEFKAGIEKLKREEEKGVKDEKK